jgi:hypothetical protein
MPPSKEPSEAGLLSFADCPECRGGLRRAAKERELSANGHHRVRVSSLDRESSADGGIVCGGFASHGESLPDGSAVSSSEERTVWPAVTDCNRIPVGGPRQPSRGPIQLHTESESCAPVDGVRETAGPPGRPHVADGDEGTDAIEGRRGSPSRWAPPDEGSESGGDGQLAARARAALASIQKANKRDR